MIVKDININTKQMDSQPRSSSAKVRPVVYLTTLTILSWSLECNYEACF